MVDATCELIKLWKDRGIVMKFVRMDNSRFEKRAKSKRLAVGHSGGLHPKRHTAAQ